MSIMSGIPKGKPQVIPSDATHEQLMSYDMFFIEINIKRLTGKSEQPYRFGKVFVTKSLNILLKQIFDHDNTFSSEENSLMVTNTWNSIPPGSPPSSSSQSSGFLMERAPSFSYEST